jgi:hypothetical protein
MVKLGVMEGKQLQRLICLVFGAVELISLYRRKCPRQIFFVSPVLLNQRVPGLQKMVVPKHCDGSELSWEVQLLKG